MTMTAVFKFALRAKVRHTGNGVLRGKVVGNFIDQENGCRALVEYIDHGGVLRCDYIYESDLELDDAPTIQPPGDH